MVSKRMASAVVLAMAALTMTGCLHRNNGAAPYSASNGFHLFGGGRKPAPVAPIGVNGYLWRATLDTLAFMPLASADPYGGVIITDWYSSAEKPDERFKCTVYILDTRLRGDGLKVTVFKEVANGQGGWAPSQVSDQTSIDIENSILTRARQLRLSNLRG
jgi:Domain of unknown function (DUF3576)